MYCSNVGSMLVRRLQRYASTISKHETSSNIAGMLGHRLRRWPNIKTTLVQCVACCVVPPGHIIRASGVWTKINWTLPATRHRPSAGLMLAQLHRRWLTHEDKHFFYIFCKSFTMLITVQWVNTSNGIYLFDIPMSWKRVTNGTISFLIIE